MIRRVLSTALLIAAGYCAVVGSSVIAEAQANDVLGIPDSPRGMIREKTISIEDTEAVETDESQLRAAEAALVHSLGQKKPGAAPKTAPASEGASSTVKAAGPEEDLADEPLTVTVDRRPAPKTPAKTQVQKTEKSSKTPARQVCASDTQLKASESKNEELQKDLEEARNRLMFAETEVRRLQEIIETRHASSLSNSSTSARSTQSGVSQKSAPPQVSKLAEPARQDGMSEESQVATVVADRAYLRTGPGKNHAPSMTISKGTRLMVETREGEWYRVIGPTGARAWIETNVVAFGEQAKVKGYDGSAEDKAFDALRNRPRN